MFKKFFILMDEATDGTASSGNGNAVTPTETNTQTPETTGDNKPADEQSTQATQEDQKPAGDSGYETDETPAITKDEKPAEGEKPTTTEQTVEDYTVEVEGVKAEDVKDIIDLAKNNKLNKDQATALVTFYKAQVDKAAQDEAAYEAKVKETYAAWAKELKEDKEFGGANYATNINNVNTVLGSHLPSLGKALKDRGARPSPALMKDLNKVYHLLHGEKPLVEGDTATQSKERNPWDFYNQGKN